MTLRCYENKHEFEANEDNWYPEDSCYRCPVCLSPSMHVDLVEAVRGIAKELEQLAEERNDPSPG